VLELYVGFAFMFEKFAAKITKITHTAKEFGGFSLTMMLWNHGDRFMILIRIKQTVPVIL